MRDQSPPAWGVSTLITSAPCCASIIAQDGPATPPVRSMTFTPANALSQSMLTVRFRPSRVHRPPNVADLGERGNPFVSHENATPPCVMRGHVDVDLQ